MGILKFKKELGLVLLLCFILSGCHFFWGNYRNNTHKFSIRFPRGWERLENTPGVTVMFRTPLSGKNDKFRENVNVVANELPETIDLTTMFDLNKSAILKLLPGVKLDVKEGEIFAGRSKGKYLAFTNKAENLDIAVKTAVWVKDKRVYVVTATAQAKDLHKYASIFNNIMGSLRF